MANVLESDPQRLIALTASRLKESGIARPAYVIFVKSSAGRERVPQSEDFWYFRCASVLRHVYLRGPIGISRLRTLYGSKKGHVVTRHHHVRSGGSIIKDAFDALEKKGYIKPTKKGRVITPAGRSLLDKLSGEALKGA